MMVDTLLTFFVIRYGWRYPLWLCVFATGFFLVIDVAFFSATLLKIADGGWFPLVIGACVFTVMTHLAARPRDPVRSACAHVGAAASRSSKSLFVDPPQRVPGHRGVPHRRRPTATPHALLHNLNHNKVLHERVVFLTVEMRDVPWVPFDERVMLRDARPRLLAGARALRLHEPPRRDARARAVRRARPRIRPDGDLVLPLAREDRAGAAGGAGMALWRERVFAAMARNAGNVTDYFNIPTNRVIELGTRVEI